MSQDRLTLGRRGEDAAVRYLRSRGMKILERNLRTPVGEIDLIARHRRILAFVEVKTRRAATYGAPAEAVDRRKQRQIIRAAKWYLQVNPHERLQPRFDVVAVLACDERLHVEHIPGAFEV